MKSNLQGVFLLSGGNMAVSIFSFVRNIIIARLISVEDFGIAATFAMTIMFVELAGNLAVDRLLIQARDSYKQQFQSAAHLFLVARGFVSAAFLFVLAAPIATLFKVPEALWAYQIIALTPIIRGFAHMDYARAQRYMRFLPIVTVEVGAAALVTLLAFPLALWFKDYSAVLYLVLLQVFATLILSHLVARRRYQLRWDLKVLYRIFEFGWPLMISGFLLLAVVQGDRFIVATALTVRELGWFSAAFMTTLMPANVVARVCLSYFLPILSKVQNDKEKFDRLYTAMIDICLFLGVLYAVGIAVAGPPLFHLLFGERYAAALDVLVFLGAVRCLTLARTGPATVAMARGDTICLMIANIVRVSSLVLAVALVWAGYGVLGVVISGLIGEIAAYVTSVALLRFRLKLEIRQFIFPNFAGLAIIVLAIWGSETFVTGLNPWLEIPLAVPVFLGALIICFLVMPRIVYQILALWDEHSLANSETGPVNGMENSRTATPAGNIKSDSSRLAANRDQYGQSRHSKLMVAFYGFRRLRKLILAACNRLEGGPFFSATLRAILARHYGVSVGRYSYGSALNCGVLPRGTTVGAYCSFGNNLAVFRRNHPTDRLSQHPFFYNSHLGFVSQDTIPDIADNPLTIGNDVWIGDNVTIVASCQTIGDGAVVAAGSVVTRDIPAFTIVAGVPAKQIRRRYTDEVEALVMKTRWWELSLADLFELDPPLTTALGPEKLKALARMAGQRKGAHSG